MGCAQAASVLGESQWPKDLGPDGRLDRLMRAVYKCTEQWRSIRNKRIEFEGKHSLNEPECQRKKRNQNGQRSYEPGGNKAVRGLGGATQIEQMQA